MRGVRKVNELVDAAACMFARVFLPRAASSAVSWDDMWRFALFWIGSTDASKSACLARRQSRCFCWRMCRRCIFLRFTSILFELSSVPGTRVVSYASASSSRMSSSLSWLPPPAVGVLSMVSVSPPGNCRRSPPRVHLGPGGVNLWWQRSGRWVGC